MQAILNLNEVLKRTDKAYILDFVSPEGRVNRAWVPISQSKVENGILWVAEWLLEAHRQGAASMMRAGYRCLNGEAIEGTVKPIEDSRPVFKASVITKGFFTVEDGEDKHRTFKFKTMKDGKTLIGLMVGRSNTTDYAWFAFVDGEKLRFWKTAKYKSVPYQLPLSHDALYECFKAILGDFESAGKRYATYYKTCSRCGKVLTTPESLAVGMGTECAGLEYGAK